MLTLSDGVDRGKLFNGQPHCDDLHRLGAAAGSPAAAALHLLDVVADFGLVRPCWICSSLTMNKSYDEKPSAVGVGEIEGACEPGS